MIIDYLDKSTMFEEMCAFILSRDFCDIQKRDKSYKNEEINKMIIELT
jgi:hypothetical protein